MTTIRFPLLGDPVLLATIATRNFMFSMSFNRFTPLERVSSLLESNYRKNSIFHLNFIAV